MHTNWTEAIKYITKNAELGGRDTQLELELGLCYANGNGVEYDIEEAIK